MGYVRPDGKVDVHIAVRPEWAKTLKGYAEYRRETMTHVIIEAVSRKMKLAGFWPVETVEEKRERRSRAIARKKARKAEENKTRSRPEPSQAVKRPRAKHRSIVKGGRRPIGKGGRPIGKDGRPIGKDGQSIVRQRKSSNGGTSPDDSGRVGIAFPHLDGKPHFQREPHGENWRQLECRKDS